MGIKVQSGNNVYFSSVCLKGKLEKIKTFQIKRRFDIATRRLSHEKLTQTKWIEADAHEVRW